MKTKLSLQKGIFSVTIAPFILVAGILSSVMYPSMNGYNERARDTNRIASLKNINLALAMYYTDYNQFPKSDGYCLDDIADEILNTYIFTLPQDPKAGHGIAGCNSGFGYRAFENEDGETFSFVAAALMENQKNSNFEGTQAFFKNMSSPQAFESLQTGMTQSNKNNWLYIIKDL